MLVSTLAMIMRPLPTDMKILFRFWFEDTSIAHAASGLVVDLDGRIIFSGLWESDGIDDVLVSKNAIFDATQFACEKEMVLFYCRTIHPILMHEIIGDSIVFILGDYLIPKWRGSDAR